MLTFPTTPTVWEQMVSSPLPLAMYGTGDGADKILAVMERLGIRLDHIFVSDDFFRGQSFRGMPVTTLGALEAQYKDFLIIVAFGSHLPEIRRRVLDMAAKHPLVIPDVPVYGGTLFDRDFALAHRNELERAYSYMADDRSREVFQNALHYKLTGDPALLVAMEDEKDEIFSRFALGPEEHYLDLGAYRGDTLEEFCQLTEGQYASMTALEPTSSTYKKLEEAWGGRPGVTLHPWAVGQAPGTLYLSKKRGRGSVFQTEPTAYPVQVASVDSLDLPVTYLKMDVEGCEEVALIGAARTLAKQAPKLNIACYHRSEDLYRLPLLIHRLQPRYDLYLRHHPCIPCWDLNLYAVPRPWDPSCYCCIY